MGSRREAVPYAESQAKVRERIEMEKTKQTLSDVFSKADTFINKGYLDVFNHAELIIDRPEKLQDITKIRAVRIDKIAYDPNEDVIDKLSGVYNALYNIGVSASVCIVGTALEAKLYLLVRSETAAPLAGEVMESMLHGSFPGIDTKRLSQSEIARLLRQMEADEYGENHIKGLTTVSLIPSMRSEESKKEQFVQGLEKFIDTMQGKEYTAVLLATPLDKETIAVRKHGLEQLYSILSPQSKLSVAYGENQSIAINKGISQSLTESVNESVSNSNTLSSSQSFGNTHTRSRSFGASSSSSSDGGSSSWNSNSGSSDSSSSSYTSGASFTNSISESTGTSNTSTESISTTDTEGSSVTRTINFDNKGVDELMEQVNGQIKRIKAWESFGLWECCGYFFSKDIAASVLAATTYKALMTGEGTGVESAHVNIWENRLEKQKKDIKTILNSVKYLIHPKARIQGYVDLGSQIVSPTCLVGGNELPILMGFPRKSVKGTSVVEMAEFGRNVIYESYLPKRSFSIGSIYHMGAEENSKVPMNLDLFSSHCFITGSSGSGKSYCTYNLLDALLKNNIKMLIIEPAKGEYKQVFGRLDKVQIFTTNPDVYKMLRINPFEFPQEIHVLSHIEQLLQIFSASWPLTAAMPAILKESVVRAYVKRGWDLQNSIWVGSAEKDKYPVFADVLETLPQIIDQSDYSAESRGNYKGALLTRVQSMTSGIIGEIFRKSEGINDRILFDGNAIIDLSETGSEETVALLMGIMIMKLNEYRKAQRKNASDDGHDSGFRHVTVLEEAHNILKRTSKEQSQEDANMVGKSVEMISNSIKEMRTYGEGFIIIDQSPMAVDSSAIENTSTKIIMNTPARDACEELGSALALNDVQTRELSRLNVGVAVVMQKGWMMPVLMKIHGDWKMSDYDASLQMAVPAVEKFLRGQILEEFIRQVKEKKYSAWNIGSIVRNADNLLNRRKGSYKDENLSEEQKKLAWSNEKWLQDRKSELQEIIQLFKCYLEESRCLTSSMISSIIIEITRAGALFDLIPIKGIHSIENISKMIDNADKYPTKSDRDRFVKRQRDLIESWSVRFTEALKSYVQVTKDIVLYEALYYMVVPKAGTSKNTRYSYVRKRIKIHIMDMQKDEIINQKFQEQVGQD